ncbi:DUF5700 domain-containing putative Zn-dependent protease [Promethearchaeum syntrophicum]|uniref:DUF5700 domain-containing putative Zn-dependent protease n=1 Tax=Promethearchaeum syntrophicum TaxID=2594042 RepID=A0A5B9D905_9ARCH|nr:DUF5700 domain-containing putative Zn-dependent protease [Candidatus Prometheoarchaeum syntrophicum]QEE15604.1 hypothetical protein DSAG12_01430 [Candidatus Prometheoarchaeum syntrophicum]
MEKSIKETISYESSTIERMISLCKQIKNGENKIKIKEELDALLESPDYKIEFARYNGRVSKEDFRDYLLNFFSLNPEEIQNEDLKVRYEHFKYFFDNIELYISNIDKIHEIFSITTLEEQKKIAQIGLPEDLELGNITFLFTIGVGMSFGWPYCDEKLGNFIHFDFIQLFKQFSIEEIHSFIAHEIHHIGVNQLHDKIDTASISLEQLFYLLFSGEGLAVKYCNNAEGILSKRFNSDITPNLGLDPFSWEYLNNDFQNTFKAFKEHLEQIRSGEISNQEELMGLFHKYWMNAHTDEQDRSDSPQLKQSRFYSFGNELWGTIQDVFGKSKVYWLFDHLSDFAHTFNEALEISGKSEYKIPL